MVVVNPSHEAADAAPATTARAPVEVVIVMTAGVVALDAKPLDPNLVSPSLKRPGSVFDAPHHLCPGDHSHFGIPHCGVALRRITAIVGDGCRLK